MGRPIVLIIAVLLGTCMLSIAQAGSTIYKHVDEDGRIIFTNRPIKGAQKVQSSPNSSRSKAIVSVTPSHFPKVSVSAQQKRDVKRREILEHELADEMKLFSDTRRHISLVSNAQETQQQKERIKRLQKRLQRHESNIASLKRELEKL